MKATMSCSRLMSWSTCLAALALELQRTQTEMAAEGERATGLAGSTVHVALVQIYTAVASSQDPLRASVSPRGISLGQIGHGAATLRLNDAFLSPIHASTSPEMTDLRWE